LKPKLEYHRYCRECKNASTRKYLRQLKPTLQALSKKTTRHYINTLIKRGKIKRLPCAYCGSIPSEFHHWHYEPRSTSGEFLCTLHHRIAHDVLKKVLTAVAELL